MRRETGARTGGMVMVDGGGKEEVVGRAGVRGGGVLMVAEWGGKKW